MDRIETVERYVDNPDFSRDHIEGRLGNVRKTPATINFRESAIATLAQKGAIDPAQTAAADKFRQFWEALGGSGVLAMDWTREAVDGGRAAQAISDRQMAAGIELKRCRAILGEHGYLIVRLVAGERRSLHEICGNRRERDTTADLLRIHLTRLAEHWGLSTRAKAMDRRGDKNTGVLSKKMRKRS